MAFDVPTDLETIYSRRTAITLHREPTIMQLMNRAWEADVMRAHQTVISVPDLSAAAATTRTREANYPTANTLGARQITLAVDQHLQANFKVHYLDMMEVPWPILEQSRQEATMTMSEQIEDNLVAYLDSLSTTTLARYDTTVADGNIGLKSYGGSAGPFINGAGEAGSTATVDAKSYILSFIKFCATRFMKINVSRGQYIGDMPSGNEMFCLLHPELFDLLVDWLAEQDYHWDMLTSGLLDGPSILQSDQWRGQLSKINIITSNSLTQPPATDASGSPWRIYCGTPKAVAFAMRPILTHIWSDAQNETSPSTVVRQLCDFGRVLVNNDLLIRGEFKTKA